MPPVFFLLASSWSIIPADVVITIKLKQKWIKILSDNPCYKLLFVFTFHISLLWLFQIFYWYKLAARTLYFLILFICLCTQTYAFLVLVTNLQKCHFLIVSLHICLPFGLIFICNRSWKSWEYQDSVYQKAEVCAQTINEWRNLKRSGVL